LYRHQRGVFFVVLAIKVMKTHAHLLLLLSFFAGSLLAQKETIWSAISENRIELTGRREIVPLHYRTFQANLSGLNQLLGTVPSEKENMLQEQRSVVFLPTPSGHIQRFYIVESPVMAPELSAAFPEIKTFSLRGIDDVYASGKADMTEFGFHAMVFSPSGDFFIDPYCLNNTKDYISYYTSDFIKDPAEVLPESGPIVSDILPQGDRRKLRPVSEQGGSLQRPPAPCAGAQLRTYRLAVACTGEYAVAATGMAAPTLSQTLARVVTSVNRVVGVYEKEVAVRLVLVPSTTLVLYTNGATDSFTGTANTNANLLINQSQSVITASIGSANYDIGHTFSTGGGGLANLGCVCVSSQKARGITGSANPVGDPYDIDYVAHEMGHQFSGNHTFNAITGSCSGNRNASTSVEPGSGVTIMAYAGICGANNVAGNSIPYFHATSYDEIYNFVTGSGNSCAVTSSTGNNPPVVTANAFYAVPKSTPFVLSGSAIDPNNDALTYSWEETDPGPGSGGNWNSGTKPFFRSYAPVVSSVRYFPKISVVNTNNYTGTIGEYLPASAQNLNFRLTARDNKMGGGGVCYASTAVQVDTAGPFKVTYPSAANIGWLVNSQQLITWDPAFTDQAPVLCDSVRILISYNSGSTYSTLVNSAPNFGFYGITAPNLSVTISTCKIRIEAIGNVFYDMSDNNFQISLDPYVGIQEVSRNNPISLSISPNPSTGLYHLSAGGLNPSASSQLSVCDVTGRVVMTKTFAPSFLLNESIDLTEYTKGIYFLRLSNADLQSVYRLVRAD
jgi:hypothetical protein